MIRLISKFMCYLLVVGLFCLVPADASTISNITITSVAGKNSIVVSGDLEGGGVHRVNVLITYKNITLRDISESTFSQNVLGYGFLDKTQPDGSFSITVSLSEELISDTYRAYISSDISNPQEIDFYFVSLGDKKRAVEALNAADNSTTLNSIITQNASYLSLDLNDYNSDGFDKDGFADIFMSSRPKNGFDITDYNGVKAVFQGACAVQLINQQSDIAGIDAVINLRSNELGIDLEAYTNLNNTLRNTLCEMLVSPKHKSINGLKTHMTKV